MAIFTSDKSVVGVRMQLILLGTGHFGPEPPGNLCSGCSRMYQLQADT